MVEANKTEVNIQKLQELTSEDVAGGSFDTRKHRLLDDKTLYACICHTIVNNLAKKNFYLEITSNTTVQKYTKTIENLLRSFYNSNSIPEAQKKLIKKDKKIKHLIIEILRRKGIWDTVEEKFTVNEAAMKNLQFEYNGHTTDNLIKDMRRTLSSILHSQFC